MLEYLTLVVQGGYVYLGEFLYHYLTGPRGGYPFVHWI